MYLVLGFTRGTYCAFLEGWKEYPKYFQGLAEKGFTRQRILTNEIEMDFHSKIMS